MQVTNYTYLHIPSLLKNNFNLNLAIKFKKYNNVLIFLEARINGSEIEIPRAKIIEKSRFYKLGSQSGQ